MAGHAGSIAIEYRGRSVRELDWLMLAVVTLCCLGLVMAVSVRGPTVGPLLAMKAQGSKLMVGLIAFLSVALVPLSWVRRAALPLFSACVVLCIVPRLLGMESKGAYRWVEIGSFSFQPVELARFWLVVLLAHLLASAGNRVHGFVRGFLPAMGCAAALSAALLAQPDHGNALIVIGLASCMALVAGVRVRHFLLVGAPVLAAMAVTASRHSYVMSRLTGFLDIRPQTQVGQSMVAIAAGGIAGRGLGSGWMKMGFVAEAQNDFVFAVIAEELGFLGSLLVVALYTVIGLVGYRLSCTIRDPFLRYLVFGFALLLCMQAAINLLVVTGWAPAKGIDLPFVSSGGTSLVLSLAAVGMIGSAARADRNSTGRV